MKNSCKDLGIRKKGMTDLKTVNIYLKPCVGILALSVKSFSGSGQFGLVRTKELLLRWAEYSVFTPVMRTHEVPTLPSPE